jgi:hypothetical protein
MGTVYKIHHTVRIVRLGTGSSGAVVREQDARWCALLQHLVRDGGAITPELEESMSAAGFDLDRLHRCLLAPRRRAPARVL